MKKYFPMISVIIFPYAMLAYPILIFTHTLTENVFLPLIFLLLWWVVCLICALVCTVRTMVKKTPASNVAFASMIIKLVMIPGYIATFIMGCILVIAPSPITYIYLLLLVCMDASLMLCTGALGASAAFRAFSEEKITKKQAIIYGFLQFVYCLDIIFAVILYRRSKKNQITS